MILFLLITHLFHLFHLLACEFQFTQNQDQKERLFDIPKADFTALGIWTKYYAFYLDISIEKVKYQYYGRQFDAYQIFTGSYDDGTYLNYFMIKENGYLSLLFILNSQQDDEHLEFQLFDGQSCEGIWMFTYIGFDIHNENMNIIILNTKTAQFQQQQYKRQVKQIDSIQLFGEGLHKYPFSGQISFTYSQIQQVNFDSGEQLITYLSSCKIDNQCTQNQKNAIILGPINSFDSYIYMVIQDDYWIDGWFIFTPNTQMNKYSNLILQLVQQRKELLNYSGIIPLKISLNFDQTNLANNGITFESSSYTRAIWDDSNLNPIKVNIFDESYQKLLQSWVYFRFLQYDQGAEFYLSFSDSNYVNKNLDKLNLFKYGNYSISLGQSQLNPYSFLGQLANINIQSCLQSYPQAQRACHFTCLTCFGPMKNNCLSCKEDTQSNRILNPFLNTCNCNVGLISIEGQVECEEIQKFMKSSSLTQFQQSVSIQCKEGQFQYKNEETIKCYDCPQQSTIGLNCADCLENPLRWQENMICSYDYFQYNHNENNTFLKHVRPSEKIDFYHIQDDKLRICLGCNLDEGNQQLINDATILYGSCQKNYFYNNDSSCQLCSQNCKECEDVSGLCYKCEAGYTLQNQSCQICPDNCLSCQYIDQIICSQCLEGFTQGNGLCYQCDTNCLLCDFDEVFNRPRCSVCKFRGYFLPFDGIDCVKNTIQNCLIQYQLMVQYLGEIDESHPPTEYSSSVNLSIRYNIKTTIGFERIQPAFRPIVRQIITNNCALCAPQYMNGDTYCSFNDTLKSDEQVLIKHNQGQCCIQSQEGKIEICQDEYFEQEGKECERKILSTELIYLISSQSHHQEVLNYCEIDECKQCLKVQNKDKCIQCSQGQYPEVLTGLCFSCPQALNCKTCQQQNSKYKDGWKWNARAYFNYQFQSDLVSSIKKEDYEVICLTCLEDYMLFDNRCILKCPINCKRCSIIDGENVCTYCGQNDQGKFLTTYNNQCINCPQNCEFCQPRLSEDVQKINNFFNPDDGSIYYNSYICLKPRLDSDIFYNQLFQKYFKCLDGALCMGQLNIKLKAYCDSESYYKEKSKYENDQNFEYENILIVNNSHLFVNIETPELIDHLNGIQVQSLLYEVSLISSTDFCSIQANIISTNLLKNVFSLTQSKLLINANNLTLISSNLEIQNFSEVQFQSSIFDSHFQLKVYHPNEIIVRLKDVYYLSKEFNFIQILIINPSRIEINNFYVQTIQNEQVSENSQMISYMYTNSSTSKNLNIWIDNLNLVKSQFYNDFLILANINDINLIVSNSIIESKFYNSSFIKQYEQDNNGSVYLNNVTFIIEAYDSSIVQLNGYFDIYCTAKFTGQLIGNIDKSFFIRTTTQFKIMNSEIFNVTLSASSVFANNMPHYYSNLNLHQIQNLIFNRVLFENQSNLISIYNSYGADTLEISNIQLIDCQLIPKYQIRNDIAFIIFEGAIFTIRDSFFNKSILGLVDICVIYCTLVVIDNVTVLGNNIQGLQNKLDCLESLLNISSKNAFINLENIEIIEIKNSHFNNIMIQNYAIIGIYFTDDNMKYQIYVTNTTLKSNIILITKEKRQGTIFQLSSTKPGNFSAINVSFTENIVNEYLQNKFQNQATTFLIEAAQFNIILKDTLFQKNQIFNSTNSILYIQAKTVQVENTIFTQSNVYDDFILKFVIWGSFSNDFFSENLQEIFPIKSQGGNGKFVVDELLVQFCQISHSIAQQGSGFHLTLQNNLQIYDTAFTSLRNKLDEDDSQGGSIYILLVAQNTSIEIKNSNFEDSSSLFDGGAIYINSRYTTSNINLSQIKVKNCYSFKGTFISAYLNKYSLIQFTNISVRNNMQGFKKFLTYFQDLDDNLVQQFHLNSAIFYIQYGSLSISNSIVSDIQLSSIIYFYAASNLFIQGIVIQNIQYGTLGLIQIFPSTYTNINAQIQNVNILNCNSIQPQQIICQIHRLSFINNFQCYNYENKPTSLTQKPQDLQAKFECFYSKLLDFTSSIQMIYVDKIQISGYLYISNLNLRNNNCSFCREGMITIKNVDISIPEFNNIILKQIYFQNNSCGSGCLVVSQQDYINFPARRVLQILNQTRFSIPFTVSLEQSEFVNNSATNGIIIISNLSLSAIDNKFIRNIGFNGSGGILFLGSQNHNFQLMQSEISENVGNKGGALYLVNKTISNIELLLILLSSNKAISFGQDLVATPQALTISLDKGKKWLQIKYLTKTPTVIQEIVIKPYRILGNDTLQQFITLPSGQNIKNYEYYDEKLKLFKPYNLSLRLIALNQLKQSVLNLQGSYCTIQKRIININLQEDEPFEEYLSNIQFNNTSQDYNLDDLIINFDPYLPFDYVLQLKFNCSSVQIPIINNSSPYNIISYSNNYELRMNIRTFKCQRGESYNALLGICNLCDASQSLYSVVIKASKCSVQDDITMKSVKSTLIELRENYWRPYDDNDIVTLCYNFPVNCNGGWSPGDESCALGHIGALCEQCDLYNVRGNGSFSVSDQFQCGSCSDLRLNTLQIFLIITWTLISIVISVKENVENVDELVIRTKAIKIGLTCVYLQRVQLAVIMKILTNYLQIISSIGTFQLKLPPVLKSVFTFSGNPIKSAMNALDCFLIQISKIEILYFRNIWYLCMPFYYTTVIFTIYLILIQMKQMNFKITVLSTTLIFIFIYAQPDIIGSFISLLSYRKISNVFWVQGDVSHLYLTPVHAKWLLSFVVPIFLIFGLIIPIILFIKMSKYKRKLNDLFVLRVYGYLYNEYNKVTYYWEIIKICQKELIIIFLTFYEDSIIIKGTIVFFVIFCYDLFSKRYRPYKRVDLNNLDSSCSNVCGFSIVIGMAIYFADQNGNPEILWPFYLSIGIFNLYFILRLITLIILGYLNKLEDKIDQIRDYLNNKFPKITEEYPQLKKYLENSKIRSKRVKQRFLKLREYLWKKVQEKIKIDSQCPEINKDKQQKKSNPSSSNSQIRNDLNKSNQQCFIEKSKNQIIIPHQEIDQKKMKISIDIKMFHNKQYLQDSKEKQINTIRDSYESIPIEIQNIYEYDFIIKQQDLENNNDDQEQSKLSFQQ